MTPWETNALGLWVPAPPQSDDLTSVVLKAAVEAAADAPPDRPVGKRGARRRRVRMERPCRVYWGSHGCGKQRGHSGEHICSGCGPPWFLEERGRRVDITLDPDKFFGEDVELYEVLAMEC